MGIEMANIPEDKLLEKLGEGDWSIALPDGYPDLIVSAAWRRQLCDDAACQFVRWVLDGVHVEIVHGYDPPWDCSGIAQHHQADPLMLLVRHETLDAWLNAEYTGNSQATFMSGMGLYWETYHDDLEDSISEEIAKLMQTHLRPWFAPSDDDFWDDEFWDVVIEVEIPLQSVLGLVVGRMTTSEAWQRFEQVVRLQIEEEKRIQAERAARYTAMREQVKQFWKQYFAELEALRIEKPQFRELKLADRLVDVLADTDPQIVEAIAEIGLPGNFSNSVRDAIQQIARQALA